MPEPSENFVLTLARSARQTISEGYYRVEDSHIPRRSMRDALETHGGTPLVAELKFESPAEGKLRPPTDNVVTIAKAYEKGGAAAISVLTEPKHFKGRLEYLTLIKRGVSLPVLMKDVVIDKPQIDAAQRIGADAVLLMASIYANRLSPYSLDEMIQYAHGRGLEVLLEAHTDDEFALSLKTGADIVGINNRDLQTLEVSLDTSKRLLGKRLPHIQPVICESGITKRSEILELSALGADGFLVGSVLMKSRNIEAAVRELTGV